MIAERSEAHRDSYKPQRIEDPVKRNESNYKKTYMRQYRQRPEVREKERQRESTPERKQKHREWDNTSRGKASAKRRGARYRATEKGRLNSLKKSRAYFERHKDDPAWREHRRQLQKAWKQRKREEQLKENQAA